MDPEREGPLTTLTNFVYRLIVIEAAFILATAPALIGIFFLEQHASNIPLYAAFALFFGPAISAGIYTWRADSDVVPWLRFWKGWVDSLRQTMVVWLPATAFTGLVAFNAAYAQVPTVFLMGGAVIAAGVAVYAIALLVIIANFSFRSRDLFQVVMYGIASAPLAALGVVSLCVLAGGVVVLWADWVLVLLASTMLWLLARTVRPLILQIHTDLVDQRAAPGAS